MDSLKAHRLVSSAVFYSFLLLLISCQSSKPKATQVFTETLSIDLDSIQSRGYLIALVDNSTTSYFIYKGQPMGFEYELLQRFAENQNLRLEVKVVYTMDEILNMLKRGEGDIVAANITVTRERAKDVAFSMPILQTRQVLVQNRKNKNLVKSATDLAGRTVHVRKGSSFYTRLKHLEDEIGKKINIIALSDSGEQKVMNKTLQLIEQVALGEIEMTVADENIARVQQKLYPEIDISVPVSFEQNIAWAMRKNDTLLLNAVNHWLEYEQKRNDFYTIYTKYFMARSQLKRKIESDFSSHRDGISPYDNLIKTYADSLNWDWRLLAAQVYQESKFDPNAQAWTGASGLLQLMPSTAQAHGVDSNSIFDPQQNLRAGIKYIQWIDDCWKHTISDSIERIKFVLASFNVGLGHIIDARNLAEKYGKNPCQWDNHVAEFVLKKSERKYYTDEVCKHGYCRGSEPYHYVDEIMNRYRHYQNLIEE